MAAWSVWFSNCASLIHILNIGVEYVSGEVKLFTSEEKAYRLAPAYPASFYHSIHPLVYPYSTDNPQVRLNELLHLNIDNLTEAELLDRVLDGFTVPTYRCLNTLPAIT
ncbi:hypothetical protein FHG87_013026 [Trinorchestia longiramus]|nr:hypothetical protein FHG87_013026 [Trinorchestia longiramus]